jgi:uncharacterized protein (DUF1697 family)
MPRYVAFLRGVMPTNAKMPELKRAFEGAGFSDVRTVLGSGNVVFTSRTRSDEALAHAAEQVMSSQLGRSFSTMVRSAAALEALLARDPFEGQDVPAEAKRVVTFLRAAPRLKTKLPVARDGVHIVAVLGREAFTAYTPHPKGPVFMKMIEQTFGKDVTTRTWNTIEKCANA